MLANRWKAVVVSIVRNREESCDVGKTREKSLKIVKIVEEIVKIVEDIVKIMKIVEIVKIVFNGSIVICDSLIGYRGHK